MIELLPLLARLHCRNPFWSQVRSGTMEYELTDIILHGRNPFWSQVRSGVEIRNPSIAPDMDVVIPSGVRSGQACFEIPYKVDEES